MKYYYGVGGGFTEDSTKAHNGKLTDRDGDEFEGVLGGGGESYSADSEAKFENQYVQNACSLLKPPHLVYLQELFL